MKGNQMTDELKRRLDAYYYGFDPTGCEPIDKILGAVACAGKSFHHTDCWRGKATVRDDHTGDTPEEWMQNAANDAAAAWNTRTDQAEVARLRKALEKAENIANDKTIFWFNQQQAALQDGDEISASEYEKRRDVASKITLEIKDVRRAALKGDG